VNVLVTGGTGFVGREVVRFLCGNNHSVRLLVRDRAAPGLGEMLASPRVQAVAADILKPASLAGALAGIDAVVHLVGIISQVGRTTFEQVHVGGTRHMLAAARAEGVARFVHMSALGTRPGAMSLYHQTKWAAEQEVRNSGLQWTIFRPSLIYGPADQFVNLFARISRFSPVVPLLGNRAARFQPVSVPVVAKAFGMAMAESQAVGQEYELCGAERLTLEEILDTILAVLGRRRVKLRVPASMARFQARLLEWFFPSVLGKAPPLNTDQIIMLNEGNVGDGRAADRVFQLEHPRFRDGIASYLRRAR